MRRSIPVSTLLATLALIATAANADEPLGEGGVPVSARAIMELVDARDDGDNGTQSMEMILIDKNGNKRERTIRSFSRDVEMDTQTIMFFESPADVKDTGFLTYDYDDDDDDDDQWLYLPEL